MRVCQAAFEVSAYIIRSGHLERPLGGPVNPLTRPSSRPRRRGRLERLENDAVALREAFDGGDLVGLELPFESDSKPDGLESDLHLARNTECATKVEVALDLDGAAPNGKAERRCDGANRDACARREGAQQ